MDQLRALAQEYAEDAVNDAVSDVAEIVEAFEEGFLSAIEFVLVHSDGSHPSDDEIEEFAELVIEKKDAGGLKGWVS